MLYTLYVYAGSMKSKLKATLLCTLMIASALAGCAGSDDDDEDPVVEDVLGCTYADAENYNPDATKDDGSCTYAEPEPEPEPEPPVAGCMDDGANNYNANAEVDDGSCDYGMAQSDIMSHYEGGMMGFADAWYNLSVSRKCRDLGTNNPCEMTIMTIGEADTHDPADAYDSASGDIISNVYDTLYRYEGDGDGGSIIVPRLATGHTVSEDGLTYTFTLRDDVFFSNGDKMTAADAVYSWCRVIGMGAPSSGVNWILTQSFDCNDADGNHDDMGGESLEVLSDTSFSVTIYDPSSAFVATIAYTVGSVINADLCEENRVIETDENGNVTSDDYCHEWMDEAPIGAADGAAPAGRGAAREGRRRRRDAARRRLGSGGNLRRAEGGEGRARRVRRCIGAGGAVPGGRRRAGPRRGPRRAGGSAAFWRRVAQPALGSAVDSSTARPPGRARRDLRPRPGAARRRGRGHIVAVARRAGREADAERLRRRRRAGAAGRPARRGSRLVQGEDEVAEPAGRRGVAGAKRNAG